jgi:hypothetical protein
MIPLEMKQKHLTCQLLWKKMSGTTVSALFTVKDVKIK